MAESLLLLWAAATVGLLLLLIATTPEEGTDLRAAVGGVVFVFIGLPSALLALLALWRPVATGLLLTGGGLLLLAVFSESPGYLLFVIVPMVSGLLFIGDWWRRLSSS